MPSPATLALTMFAAAAAPAQSTIQQRPELTAGGPAVMDVAGVKLGMSPGQVRTALARAGYHVQRTDETPDFDQEVSSEANFRLKGVGRMDGRARGVARISAAGPGRELLTVDFAQWPSGSIAAAISLSVPEGRQAAAAFRQQVMARYGRPTLLPNSDEPKWCTVGDPQCSPMGAPVLPNLVASLHSRSLWLRYGEAADRQRRAAVKAAADAKLPPAATSAF